MVQELPRQHLQEGSRHPQALMLSLVMNQTGFRWQLPHWCLHLRGHAAPPPACPQPNYTKSVRASRRTTSPDWREVVKGTSVSRSPTAGKPTAKLHSQGADPRCRRRARCGRRSPHGRRRAGRRRRRRARPPVAAASAPARHRDGGGRLQGVDPHGHVDPPPGTPDPAHKTPDAKASNGGRGKGGGARTGAVGDGSSPRCAAQSAAAHRSFRLFCF